jgi:hypothetical protein
MPQAPSLTELATEVDTLRGRQSELAELLDSDFDAEALARQAEAYNDGMTLLLERLEALAEAYQASDADLDGEPRWLQIAPLLTALRDHHQHLQERLARHHADLLAMRSHLRQGSRTVSAYADNASDPEGRFIDDSS